MTSTAPIPLLLKTVLSGGVALGAMLCAMSPSGAEVGVTAAVNVDARGRPPGGAPRVLALGTNIVHNEQVTTDGQGLVQILLLDGTTFTVGPNSDLTIDEFVYNPATGEAKVVASLTKGVFRFVGARTSQTEGGAIVKTPVGTIGIRGAVSNISYDPETGETKAALVAGNSLTIADFDGTERRVYETGYTAVITKTEGGGTTTTVRKSTKEETAVFQKFTSGKPGQNGGNTGAPPSDEQAEQVAETNSGLPDNMTVPGSLKPVESSDPDQAVDEVVDGKTQDDLDNDIEEEQEQPQPNARLLTAAAGGYVTDPLNGGGTVPDPGPRGLVGSTPPDSDQNLLLSVQGDRLATSDGTTLDLPDYSGAEGDGPVNSLYELDDFFVDGDATYLGQELGGTAYAGRGDFVAYLLGIDGFADQPVYVIYGTPTTDAQLGQFSDSSVNIREYSLTEDPIGGSPVPFFRDDLYGDVNELYGVDQVALSSTNLIIVESNGGNDMRAFQSWVHISGEGAGQKSAAFLYTAGVGENADGKLLIDGGRRGTYRTGAYSGPVNMRGGAASIAGGSGDHFFGENADHFVIGATPSPADHYSDVALDDTPGFDGRYGTHHVASLVKETPLTEPARTERTVTGFISGMAESNANANPYMLTNTILDPDGDGPLATAPAPNLTLNLDPGTNTVQGEAELFDVLNQDTVAASYLIGFGRSGNLGGGSAFVDDDVFGAQKDNDPEKTRIRTDGVIGDDGPDDVAHTGQFTPGTYLVSGRANPIDGYQHLEGCTQCDFIDWGWWGTRVEVAAGASDEIPDDRVDYVHMGTWVAGDVSTEDEIEAIAGLPAFEGEVSYDGTVMANVVRDTDPGAAVSNASYIATGDLSVNYNFGSRTGTVNIDQFDVGSVGPAGISLDGEIGENDSMRSQLFSGTLSGNNLYTMGDPYNGDDPLNNDMLTGNLSGAFVNSSVTPPDLGPNVAAGLVGNFDFTGANVEAGVGADVKAAGTMAGVRVLPQP